MKGGCSQATPYFLSDDVDVQNSGSATTVVIRADADHRKQFDGCLPIRGVGMEPLGFASSSGRRNIRGRLDVVNELGAGPLVWRRDQFAKSAVEADEHPVAVVETEAAHHHAVGPPRQALADFADEPVETVRTPFAHAIADKTLEKAFIELFVVVDGEAFDRVEQVAGECARDFESPSVR